MRRGIEGMQTPISIHSASNYFQKSTCHDMLGIVVGFIISRVDSSRELLAKGVPVRNRKTPQPKVLRTCVLVEAQEEALLKAPCGTAAGNL